MDSSNIILLVEDNSDDVLLFKLALRNAKITYPLNVVTNGQEAVDYLSGTGQYADREKYPLPFMIFLDLKTPCLDGFEVLAWIERRPMFQSIAVVALSGSDEPKDHKRAYVLGGRFYLVKPPKPEELRQVIDSLRDVSAGK